MALLFARGDVMSAAMPAFNATALPFTAELAAAEKSYAENPADPGPFVRLDAALMQRRTAALEEAMNGPVTQTTFDAFAVMQSAISDASDELKGVAPLDAPAKIGGFIARFQQLLQTTLADSAESRQAMVTLGDNTRKVCEDYALFNDVLQNLAGQHAADPLACPDGIRALAAVAAQRHDHLLSETAQVSALQHTAQLQLDQMAALQRDMENKLVLLKNSTRDAEAFKDFVDSCSTGTRAPVAVGKPLALKSRAAFAQRGMT